MSMNMYDDSAFLVPLEVKFINNKIGHGLFTKTDIPKGKLLWTPKLVKKYSIEECTRILQSKSREDGNTWLRQSFVLRDDQNYLCVNETDVGRFMNHSSNPNTGAASAEEPSIALRNINAGEELTCDYSTLGSPYWYQELCEKYCVIPTNDVASLYFNYGVETQSNQVKFDYPHDIGFKEQPLDAVAGVYAQTLDISTEKPLQQWEYQIHALLVVLSTKSPPLLSTDELRRGVESLEREVYESWGYYERWAASMTHILIERNVFTFQQIDEELGVLTEETEEILYEVGDIVRIKDINTKTRFRKPHLRVPGYVHGLHGKITRYVGSYKNPSLLAFRVQTSVHVPLYIAEIPVEAIKNSRYYYDDRNTSHSSRLHSDSKQMNIDTEVIQLEVYQSWLEPVTTTTATKYAATAVNDSMIKNESTKRRKYDVDNSTSHNHSTIDDHDHNHSHSGAHDHAHDHSHSHGHSHECRDDVEATALIRENSNLTSSDSPGQTLAERLIRLLVRLDIIQLDTLQKTIDKLEANTQAMLGADLVVTAWLDPGFKERLLTDAPTAAKELHIITSNPNAPTNLVVFENTDFIHHTVVCTLCSCYPAAVLGLSPAWYKSRIYRSCMVSEPRTLLSNSFGLVLPNSMKIVVHDSTADCRYMVLPQRPVHTEGLTYAQLRALVTRDSMIGVSRL